MTPTTFKRTALNSLAWRETDCTFTRKDGVLTALNRSTGEIVDWCQSLNPSRPLRNPWGYGLREDAMVEGPDPVEARALWFMGQKEAA